jgi:glycosyltransferase involved in cell wall biosynthesis
MRRGEITATTTLNERYSPMYEITICMPTQNSASVIQETLDCAATAIDNAPIEIAELYVVDNVSSDETREIVREAAADHDWPVTVESMKSSLPDARQQLIESCETEWLWFLDDDARVDADYLQRLTSLIGPETGAVQGRKQHAGMSPTDWLTYRARRGGTHATLIRHDALEGIDIPSELHVLEDEYIRRHVDASGFVWEFHPHAYFTHDNQDRHPIGFQEGYLGAKYDLSRFTFVLFNVAFAVVMRRDIVGRMKVFAGWVWGKMDSERGNS